MTRTLAGTLLVVLAGLGAQACIGPAGSTVGEKRTSAEELRKQVLAEFYQRRPDLKDEVESAPVCTVATLVSVHPGVFSIANGYGVAFERATGRSTYYRQIRFGLGPGLAIKSLRVVGILRDPAQLHGHRESRWGFGGLLEATFKFGDFGGSAAKSSATGVPGFRYYTWTQNGAALEAGVGVIRVSPIEELNEPPPARGTAVDSPAAQGRVSPDASAP